MTTRAELYVDGLLLYRRDLEVESESESEFELLFGSDWGKIHQNYKGIPQDQEGPVELDPGIWRDYDAASGEVIRIECEQNDIDQWAGAFDDLSEGDLLRCVQVRTNPSSFLPWVDNLVTAARTHALWEMALRQKGNDFKADEEGLSAQRRDGEIVLSGGDTKYLQQSFENYLERMNVGIFPRAASAATISNVTNERINKITDENNRLLHQRPRVDTGVPYYIDPSIRRSDEYPISHGMLIVVDREITGPFEPKYIKRSGPRLFKVYGIQTEVEMDIIIHDIRQVSDKRVEQGERPQ